MKKHFLFLTILLVAAVSCKKEYTTTDTSQGEATLARIMNFKQQVDYYKDNPAVKDGESVTLDEAIWNIEALFNLTYAYPELSYGHTKTADTVLYLPVGSGNTVLLTNLSVFYGQMYEVISDIYHGIELDNKQFIILDVELGDRHGNQQAIRLQCVQGSVRGIQPPTPQPIYWAPFADGPNWYYGQNGGMLNNHLEGEMDAADTLANMLNTLLVPKPPVGQQYIYTEIMMKELPNNYHEPFSHNLYPGEYCEFYVHNPEQADFWLSTDQLNFHYFGERYLVCSVFFSDLTNPIPSGHSLFNIVINDYSLTSNGSTSIGHHTQAYYGLRNILWDNNLVKVNL